MTDRLSLVVGSVFASSSSAVVQELVIGSVSLFLGLLTAFLGAIVAFFTNRYLKKKYAKT